MHVRSLIKNAGEYAGAGVQIMIAVLEGREEAAKWKSKNSIPFPVVTGRRGSAHEAVGLTKKVFGSMQQSGSILTDSHNTIQHAHGATMPISSYDKKASPLPSTGCASRQPAELLTSRPATCGCPRRIRVARAVLAEAAIVCTACEQEFLAIDDEQ